ncbi:YnfU family zinc-binding protein [Budvicia aquatica]|uniref:Uncharacterized protein n=2 Tax=Budvicia aquatica TaxID=82979 RepID=A0A484ZL68_9GAMM|nr:Uncharacterised protein [Budvicia aquatica]
MSYFKLIMEKLKGRLSNVTCPVCHETSNQLTTKISQNLVLICPHCRALFVIQKE